MSFDCCACGCCCLAGDKDFVYVLVPGEEDEPIIREGREDLLEYDGFDIWLKTKQLGDYTSCMALEGELGEDCHCSIYEARPSVCRKFEPGLAACLLARSNLGLSLRESEDLVLSPPSGSTDR